jgi:hypothetical protein
MVEIRSTVQLQNVMMSVAQDALDETTRQVLVLLQQKIQEIVYDNYSPSVYDRTHEFFESFERSNAQIMGNVIQTTIDQNPLTMELNQEEGIHGSIYKNVEWDIRESLADILINGGDGTPHVGGRFGSGWWTEEKRDFWSPFIKYFDDGTVSKMLKENFAKREIKVI